jgi:parallel beta-helix repeat protein
MVLDNRLTGALSYGIAITSASNFTVQNNVMFGNTSFIGARGPNCSASDIVPTPAAFIMDTNTISNFAIQSDFQTIPDGNSLTCVLPPNGGDYWPFGLNPSNTSTTAASAGPTSTNGKGSPPSKSHNSAAAVAVGVIVGIIACAIVSFFIRKWAIKRSEAQLHLSPTRDYIHKLS